MWIPSDFCKILLGQDVPPYQRHEYVFIVCSEPVGQRPGVMEDAIPAIFGGAGCQGANHFMPQPGISKVARCRRLERGPQRILRFCCAEHPQDVKDVSEKSVTAIR